MSWAFSGRRRKGGLEGFFLGLTRFLLWTPHSDQACSKLLWGSIFLTSSKYKNRCNDTFNDCQQTGQGVGPSGRGAGWSTDPTRLSAVSQRQLECLCCCLAYRANLAFAVPINRIFNANATTAPGHKSTQSSSFTRCLRPSCGVPRFFRPFLAWVHYDTEHRLPVTLLFDPDIKSKFTQ